MLGTFSFVDRITEVEPGKRAGGCFAIPAGLGHFSAGLAAEAVGQLAAWVAMAHADFQRRPVAALAEDVRFAGPALPGHVLDLSVQIGSLDRDAVVYGGRARMGDVPVIELCQCVGAMVPMEDFEVPEAARAHFAVLRGPGALSGRFPGVAEPHCEVTDREPGKRVHAALQVPAAAPFFADHFPRRPVFPATLLLDAALGLAADLGRDAMRRAVRPRRLQHVKLRNFILPGQVVEIGIDRKANAQDVVTYAFTAAAAGERVATARVEIVPQGAP